MVTVVAAWASRGKWAVRDSGDAVLVHFTGGG